MKKLNAKQLLVLPKGKYHDGNGLYISISGVKESYSEDKLFKYYSTWDDFKLCKNLMINGEWVYKKKYYNGKEIK